MMMGLLWEAEGIAKSPSRTPPLGRDDDMVEDSGRTLGGDSKLPLLPPEVAVSLWSGGCVGRPKAAVKLKRLPDCLDELGVPVVMPILRSWGGLCGRVEVLEQSRGAVVVVNGFGRLEVLGL